jgi:polyphosphate kinase
MKISDPITGFRLPRTMLATVDSLCAKQDLTRSQVFRRSVTEYLKSQNAIVTDVNLREPQRSWPTELFERQRRT